MAKAIITESSLEDISDAIREKLGTSDTYLPSEMAAAIRSISSIDPETEAKIEAMQEQIDAMQEQIDSIISGGHWTHQLDGVTLQSGTVNFITTGGST